MLEAAREGDGSALGRLLDVHRNYLRLLARIEIGRRLQPKIDASDVVQETFLRAQRGFSEFRGTTTGETVAWLRRILATQLSNTFRHYLGTQRRNAQLERELEAELDRSSQALARRLVLSQTSPSKGAARHEDSLALADALERLSDAHRSVVTLHNLRGMTFPEVAEAMGRSVGSVEKLWTRALIRLRRELKERE